MNNRHLYAKNFEKRARACKEQAGQRCQECGMERGTVLVSRWSGRVWSLYLVAAHPDHDPGNPNARLICCCPRCHFLYYASPRQLPEYLWEKRRHRHLLRKKGLTSS